MYVCMLSKFATFSRCHGRSLGSRVGSLLLGRSSLQCIVGQYHQGGCGATIKVGVVPPLRWAWHHHHSGCGTSDRTTIEVGVVPPSQWAWYHHQSGCGTTIEVGVVPTTEMGVALAPPSHPLCTLFVVAVNLHWQAPPPYKASPDPPPRSGTRAASSASRL